MIDKKIKYNDRTKFKIIREIIIHENVGNDGYKYIQKGCVEEIPNQNKDFELGSVRKPKNKDVIELKWEIPK